MFKPRSNHRGFGLIEVLVSLMITSFGLLGLAALLVRGQQAEMESLQRTRALTLVQDMVNRINLNRKAAGCYDITDPATGTPFLGTGNAVVYNCINWGSAVMQARADADLREWDALLKGQGESLNGQQVAALIGARGCITYNQVTRIYTVAVAWQGLGQTADPSSTDAVLDQALDCATGQLGGAGLRRVVAMTGQMADLD